MADLSFEVTNVEAVTRGLTPLVQFNLRITSTPEAETLKAVILHTQIQIEATRRTYTPREQERLREIFGTPDRWGQTLRNRLWTHVTTTVPSFSGSVDVPLPVPCSYDLNVLGNKYFYALENGTVLLLFLFSGTVFYTDPDGRVQIQPISWEKECTYRMPVQIWRDLMEHHFPNSAWLYLQRDVFDRLYEYKRRQGIATWDQTIERLLPDEVST